MKISRPLLFRSSFHKKTEIGNRAMPYRRMLSDCVFISFVGHVILCEKILVKNSTGKPKPYSKHAEKMMHSYNSSHVHTMFSCLQINVEMT